MDVPMSNNPQQPTMADLFQMINDTQSRLGQLQSQFRDQSEENAQLKKKLGAL